MYQINNSKVETMDLPNLPKLIDLSCVKTDIVMEDLRAMVALAKKHRFICCFAMPCYTAWLIEQLKDDQDIQVGGAVGFPSGADLTEAKMLTAERFVAAGCGELDMVINVGALKNRDYAMVSRDLEQVKAAAGERTLKVILEVACLTDDEIRKGSELAVRAGAAYDKTGTGWPKQPTTV